MKRNNKTIPTCPGCREPVYAGGFFTFKNRQGTWHDHCYEEAYKKGGLTKKKKKFCGRCEMPLENVMDSFRYKNPRTGKVSYMHGSCFVTQVDRDHGYDRTQPDGQAKRKKKTGRKPLYTQTSF